MTKYLAQGNVKIDGETRVIVRPLGRAHRVGGGSRAISIKEATRLYNSNRIEGWYPNKTAVLKGHQTVRGYLKRK